jgi:hypothetical protein
VIDWANDKIVELIAVLRAAAVLLAVAMVAYAYLKTRSFVTLVVAALTAGFFLFTINNTDWWQQKVDEESQRLAPVATALTADAGPHAGSPVVWVAGGSRG